MAKKKIKKAIKKAVAEVLSEDEKEPEKGSEILREMGKLGGIAWTNQQQICDINTRIDRLVAALSTAKPIKKDM